jgi:hypothetical protein
MVDFDELSNEPLFRLEVSVKREELKDIAWHLVREFVEIPYRSFRKTMSSRAVLYLPARSLKGLCLSVHSVEMVEMETEVTVEGISASRP